MVLDVGQHSSWGMWRGDSIPNGGYGDPGRTGMLAPMGEMQEDDNMEGGGR